ncbi:phage capsid protein [Cereibacter azotoformans]|uniref:phage capsid protein n=1 Tax=Cereibacter azotoformans TaxID=43057 RepID=UPI001F2B657C|nr:phage capsid protein [Cereibacter azotoformans]
MARQNLDDLRRARKMAAVAARVGALAAAETPDAAALKRRPRPLPLPKPLSPESMRP